MSPSRPSSVCPTRKSLACGTASMRATRAGGCTRCRRCRRCRRSRRTVSREGAAGRSPSCRYAHREACRGAPVWAPERGWHNIILPWAAWAVGKYVPDSPSKAPASFLCPDCFYRLSCGRSGCSLAELLSLAAPLLPSAVLLFLSSAPLSWPSTATAP